MKERVWKRYKLKLLACEALPVNKETTEKRWLYGITDWMDMSLRKHWELVMDREACYATVHRFGKGPTELTD